MDYHELEAAVSEPPASQQTTGLNVRSALREIAETVLLTLVIFLAVRAVVQNFKVEGSSMEPNLHSGQYLLVNKAVYFNLDVEWLRERLPSLQQVIPRDRDVMYLFGAPQRGDVIVFRYPKDPTRDFIKRVIALPGDTVEIREGRIFVNGQQLVEPYIDDGDRLTYACSTYRVPPGEFFVLGDNRNNSSGSHVWGPVPREYIVGKAWVVYWPADAWGLAPNYPIAAKDR